MSIWQRRLVFFLIFGGGLLLLLAVTLLLVNQSLNSGARVTSVVLVPDVTVRQFAALPDDDAYPAAIAVAPDGTVYTGSFATGAIWAISPDGGVRELPGARDAIGAVMGLAVASDGALIVIDQLDTDPRSLGGKVVRVSDDEVTAFADVGFVAPNDLAVDAQRRVYVSDPGANRIWRFDADGTNGAVWWISPAQVDPEAETQPAVTGLAYDPVGDAIIVTDPELNDVYRVAVADAATEVIYRHDDRSNPPGFDGVTVTPDGSIYVAALGQNGVARVVEGRLDYIAGLFRGSSDVEFAAPNRLYVTNWDQASLAPVAGLIVHPQLPFALDVIELDDRT
jgi:sugar lactone lactonase YvrE